MLKPIILISCFLCSYLLTAQVPDSVMYKFLDPYYFHLQYLKEDSAMLIDVREFFEFRRNRIKDAVNLPSFKNLDITADTLDKNYALFLYCTTDTRSIQVTKFLYEKGFRKLYCLEGGIQAWRKDGYPVDKKNIRRKKK